MEKQSDQPRIVFKQIKGFQAIDDQGKVKTILFLNASREVVAIIGEFIWCFLLIIITMHSNTKYKFYGIKKVAVIKIFKLPNSLIYLFCYFHFIYLQSQI